MRILIIGQGAREHALAFKISQSPLVSRVYVAPGNPGMEDVALSVGLSATDTEGLVGFIREQNIALSVVGPELPLAMGIVDALEREGFRVLGPTQEAARLETSKVFAKELLKTLGIPTADFRVFSSYQEAEAYAKKTEYPLVVKVDGLAAGKGVFVCQNLQEALSALQGIFIKRAFGKAGDRVVIEEALVGVEASAFGLSDGESLIPLPMARDYKRLMDHDQGPNTGGMGAYVPHPLSMSDALSNLDERVMKPVIEGMQSMGCPFRGVLYAGLMITKEGPKVLEFNVRFGDPETQALVMGLEGDIVPLIMGASRAGGLKGLKVPKLSSSAVCVVLASRGYPENPEVGKPIFGLEEARLCDGVRVFHAATSRLEEGWVTSGGRVLSVVGKASSLDEARLKAYRAVDRVVFEGMSFRRDIARP